jgi:hypothetical protein
MLLSQGLIVKNESLMQTELIGKWVEVTLVDGKKWTGQIEEWDEEALFITNGHAFGTPEHKGAECANNEVKDVVESSSREFSIA